MRAADPALHFRSSACHQFLSVCQDHDNRQSEAKSDQDKPEFYE